MLIRCLCGSNPPARIFEGVGVNPCESVTAKFYTMSGANPLLHQKALAHSQVPLLYLGGETMMNLYSIIAIDGEKFSFMCSVYKTRKEAQEFIEKSKTPDRYIVYEFPS